MDGGERFVMTTGTMPMQLLSAENRDIAPKVLHVLAPSHTCDIISKGYERHLSWGANVVRYIMLNAI